MRASSSRALQSRLLLRASSVSEQQGAVVEQASLELAAEGRGRVVAAHGFDDRLLRSEGMADATH